MSDPRPDATAEMGLRVQHDPFDARADADPHWRQRELGRRDHVLWTTVFCVICRKRIVEIDH